MKVTDTKINGLLVIEPKVYKDNRGYFFESFNSSKLPVEVAQIDWVQENESFSTKGVLRGLHFQIGTMAQSKLVRVIAGSIYDVAVDVRKDSPSFGQWFGIHLNGENKKQLFIPRGFAHGFVVLSETATFLYKCDNFYAPEAEGGVIYNDPQLGIEWPIDTEEMIISEKDRNLPSLADYTASSVL